MYSYPGCQLAHEWKGWPKEVALFFVEPKLDGFRLSAVLERINGQITVNYHCRDAETPGWAEHLEHITTELIALVSHVETRGSVVDRALANGPVMFDGEIMAASWNETSKLLRRKRAQMSAELRQRIVQEVQFNIFDLVFLNELGIEAAPRRPTKERQVYRIPFSKRRQHLECFLQKCRDKLTGFPRAYGSLRLGVSVTASSVAELDLLCEEFIEQGYEGAIIKDPAAFYVFERSKGWLKRKPTKTFDVRITGSVEGLGKHAGRLGALQCVNADGKAIDVGGGFTDEQREQFWADREKLPGKLIEIRVQDDAVSVARHPVFIRVRDDLNKE